jgi:hypothetical protein
MCNLRAEFLRMLNCYLSMYRKIKQLNLKNIKLITETEEIYILN